MYQRVVLDNLATVMPCAHLAIVKLMYMGTPDVCCAQVSKARCFSSTPGITERLQVDWPY
jgi:hypothetical protein